MEMILLDWTRMGKSYCLAGVVEQGGTFRVVRPLMAKLRTAPVRNVGWSAYLLDGHSRWEIFDLVAPEAATPEPPHLEDLWVRSLRSRGCLASPQRRRAVLEATRNQTVEQTFGTPLQMTRAAAYLQPGTGQRSLATIVVATNRITIAGFWREGAVGPEYRVNLDVPGLEGRSLSLKDHHLLCRAERVGRDLNGQLAELRRTVQQMGTEVAVRLGLSRAFQYDAGRAPAACWLMADGFFSLSDPQP